jgi:flagellar hook-associated protein 2
MGGVRMTGLISGMDTESIVKELVKANSTKVDKAKQEKQKLEWKKEAWQSLNTDIYNFFKGSVASLKTNGSFQTKSAKASDESKVSVKAGANGANGTHTVSVKQLASSAYLTGEVVKGNETTGDVKGSTKLTDLNIAAGTTFSIKGKDFVVDENTTLKDLASGLSKLGVNANYDEARGRFYINSSGTGSENNIDISITSGSSDALDKLGLTVEAGAKKVNAQDAIIEYNGVEYVGDSNTFEINGLTITAKGVTGKFDKTNGTFSDDSPISVNVSSDTEGMYNTIKKFVKEYNELIDKMNTLYNEDSEGYDPLTDDERNQLSDDQIEKWEEKAKKGLLRRDSTISNLLSKMRSILNKGIEVTDKDGNTTKVSLASLGIVTGDYTERGKLHIMGDEDDEAYSGQDNKLRAALENNPEIFSQVFAGSKEKQGVGYQLYDFLNTSMKRTSSSSSLTFYNDLTMKSEIEDKDDEIDKWEEKLQKMEDKYYKQFSAMETAMAKMQEQQSYISQLMGM